MQALPHVCPCMRANEAISMCVSVCTCAHLSRQLTCVNHFTLYPWSLLALDRSPTAPLGGLRAPGPRLKKMPAPCKHATEMSSERAWRRQRGTFGMQWPLPFAPGHPRDLHLHTHRSLGGEERGKLCPSQLLKKIAQRGGHACGP